MYNKITVGAVGAGDPAPIKVSTEVFEGYGECVKMSNGTVELFITKEVGPRVICYRYVGGKNIFGTLKKGEGDIKTELGTWEAFGGHRFWHAPELTGTYAPDSNPVQFDMVGRSTARFVCDCKEITGMRKEMYVRLDKTGSCVTVTHTLTNKGLLPVTVAPWGITIMESDGTAIIPQEPYAKHSENVLPVRPMVMWAFTNLSDERFKIGKRYVRLACDSSLKEPQKFGVTDTLGWAAYAKGSRLFVKRFGYDKSFNYPDYGCNVEVYTAGRMLELETLGQLEMLKPGESATHVEHWYLFSDVELGTTEESIAKKLLPIIHKTDK